MNSINKSSNKNFGIVFFLFFFIVAVYPMYFGENFRFWSFIISLIFLILGLINSRILTPLNFLWFKFGILLGKILSPVVMGLIFFLVVTPTGLIMRALRKDLLNLKKKDAKSYWIKRNISKTDMKNQF